MMGRQLGLLGLRGGGGLQRLVPFLLSSSWGLWIASFDTTIALADSREELFERVFGDAVRLDREIVARVRAMPAGERLFVDRDGDGRNDEAWYIDTAPRHEAKARPLLVRAIDEDGDLEEDHGPDLDSDLYVGDWRADGRVDVVLDYQDNDGDGDVDEMGIYFWLPRDPWLGKGGLRVWWGRDDGDDNLLWYDVNLTYQQRQCQWRSHFSGDETFVAFGLTADSERWVSIWENPFVFFDPDGDLASEVVIRFSGLADEVEAVRYSFDADDDAYGRRTHDYDFSITSIAEGSRFVGGGKARGSDLKLPEEITSSIQLRGIPTGRWLEREHARQFAVEARWARAVLTWDEINANTDGNVRRDPYERWEGVIAHSSRDFPQIGGPSCGATNRRNEVSFQPPSPLRLYYDAADRRLHLRGANKGWLFVDYDFDGRLDATYTYLDNNGDGILDRRQIDLDADGKAEFDWPMEGKPGDVPLKFEEIRKLYRSQLERTLQDSQRFIDVARGVLTERLREPDPVETFFLSRLESWMEVSRLGRRMRETPAGARLYVDLLRDRLFRRLEKHYGERAAWSAIESLYAAGDYRGAGEIVDKELGVPSRDVSTRAFRDFTHRLAVRIENRGGAQRVNWPVAFAVREIRAVARDFHPRNCAAVAPERWIDWREVPHQVDVLDPEIGEELSILVDVPANGSTTYYLYYSPLSHEKTEFEPRTAASVDRVPASVGWESRLVAYWMRSGQFGFLGKPAGRLIFEESVSEPEGSVTDAVAAGTTSGLGGLTLYAEGQQVLVQDPEGKGALEFERRVLSRGPVRSAVEIVARNVIPARPNLAIRICCLIYAEHQETEIRVTVTGARDEVNLAPGFTKLRCERSSFRPERGFFATWGAQSAAVGDIGMGLIVPPGAYQGTVEATGEHRFLLRTAGKNLRYWLVGDWRWGRQYPVAPTAENWSRELSALAGLLLNDVNVTIGEPEKVR